MAIFEAVPCPPENGLENREFTLERAASLGLQYSIFLGNVFIS